MRSHAGMAKQAMRRRIAIRASLRLWLALSLGRAYTKAGKTECQKRGGAVIARLQRWSLRSSDQFKRVSEQRNRGPVE